MSKLNWFQTADSHTASSNEMVGTFKSQVAGVACSICLEQSFTGALSGTFSTEDDELKIIGGIINRNGEAFGFLLEPQSHYPIAMFYAHISPQGIALDIDMPDITEILRQGNPERMLFSRQCNNEINQTPH